MKNCIVCISGEFAGEMTHLGHGHVGAGTASFVLGEIKSQGYEKVRDALCPTHRESFEAACKAGNELEAAEKARLQ